MSINRRTAIAVRSIGVASAAAALALGVAGNAFACNITEFSGSAACVSGKSVITINDKDSSTFVDLTVKEGDTPVGGLKHVKGESNDTGVNFDITGDWKPDTTYTVSVDKSNGGRGSHVGDVTVKTPAEACSTPAGDTGAQTGGDTGAQTGGDTGAQTGGDTGAQTGGDTGAQTGGDTGAQTGGDTGAQTGGSTTGDTAPTASASPSTSAPAAVVDDTNAPSPAAGGTENLAETGSSSSTPMIAGIAAALVAVGGGAVFMLRRRKPAAHN